MAARGWRAAHRRGGGKYGDNGATEISPPEVPAARHDILAKSGIQMAQLGQVSQLRDDRDLDAPL